MAPDPAAFAAAAVSVAMAAAALLPHPASASGPSAAVGVNWGTMASHPINPPAVVDMLRANGVGRVKLFDADPWTVAALAGSGLQAMLAAPNDQLAALSRDPRRARDWVRRNVTTNRDAGVDVRYTTPPPTTAPGRSLLRASRGLVDGSAPSDDAHECVLFVLRASVWWNSMRCRPERVRDACACDTVELSCMARMGAWCVLDSWCADNVW
jgi:hypothetical protein